jgi:hypothetical protein
MQPPPLAPLRLTLQAFWLPVPDSITACTLDIQTTLDLIFSFYVVPSMDKCMENTNMNKKTANLN